MDQDEYHIVEDQPLRILDLFPKREMHTLSLNYRNYSKLYQNLTCTICCQLFKSPVYLKCSHRFCKECIQKYIRSSAKRSCPNCRGQLTTKRDLRSDYSLQSLVTFAFTDAKSFTASMEQLDRIDIQRRKILGLRKIDSLNESKQRTKQQTPEQNINVLPGLKRVKTNEADEPKRKKKAQSEKKIESKSMIQKQEKEVSSVSRAVKKQEPNYVPRLLQGNSLTQLSSKGQAVNGQIPRRQRSQKKKIQIIQIESNSEHYDREVEQIRRQQFLNPSEAGGQDKHICSISIIPEVLPEVQSRNFCLHEFPIQTNRSIQSQQNHQYHFQQQLLPLQTAKLPSEKNHSQNPQILRAIQLLQAQFGASFPMKIIELTPFSFFTELTLKKHPLSVLTPEMVNSCYKFSMRTALTSVSSFISDALNIRRETIRLHIVQFESKDSMNCVQVSHCLKLYQVNERFWRNYCGVELLEVGGLISQVNELISGEGGSRGWGENEKMQRVIYYSIDFSKLTI